MALSRTLLDGSVAAGNVTTASFTPANNSLLVVFGGAVSNNDADTTLNITNSAGLTATQRGTTQIGSTTFRCKGGMWTIPVTTGTSMTVTIGCTSAPGSAGVRVYQYTGFDTTTPIGATLSVAGAIDDGAITKTLSASPASSSDVLAFLVGTLSGGGMSVTHGTGWTELFDVADRDWMEFQGQARTGSTSASVLWDDVAVGDIYANGPVYLALEIKAAAGGATNYTLTASAGSFSETGQAANLAAGRVLTAAQGTFSETGVAANLIHGYVMAAAQGSFTETGLDANLAFGRVLTAAQGTFAQTGVAANLAAGRVLTADVGSFGLTGNDAGLIFGRVLTASAGSFGETGVAAALTAARVLIADFGTYLYDGVAATLTKSGVTGYTLTADSGSFALSGVAAGLGAGYMLTASAGAYALTGQDAALSNVRAYVLTADAGSFTVSGLPASLVAARYLTASTGTFSLSGLDAGLAYGRMLNAAAGAFTSTGIDARLAFNRVLTADSGTYTLPASFAQLIYSGAVVPTLTQWLARRKWKPKMADIESALTPASQAIVAATPKKILTYNPKRIRFYIDNTSGGILYVRKITAPSSTVANTAGTYDFAIATGGSYVSDPKEWSGDLWAYSVAGGTINVSESI